MLETLDFRSSLKSRLLSLVSREVDLLRIAFLTHLNTQVLRKIGIIYDL